MNYHLEESDILLSSMSPKVDKSVKKVPVRKISKLALKKEFRRSSIYDKLHVVRKDVIVSVSDAETESTSTDSTNVPFIDTSNKNGSAIAEANLNTETPSKSLKLKQINKWVAEVNANRKDTCECITDTNSYNTSVFSEISAVYVDEDKINLNIGSSNACLSVNSTFMNDKQNIRFDEMLNMKNKKSEDCVDEIKNNELNKMSDEIIIVNDSFCENECLETPVKTVAQIEEHQKLLDELYGHSWRSNKKQILTISNSKHLQKLSTNKVCPKSEMKPSESITYKNPCLFSEDSKSNNLLRTLHTAGMQTTVSPWSNNLRDVCNFDSTAHNLYFKSTNKCKTRLNFDDSYTGDENYDPSKSIIVDIKVDINNVGSSQKYCKCDSSEYSTETSPLENKRNVSLDKEEQEKLRQNKTQTTGASDNMLIMSTEVQYLNDNVKKKNITKAKPSSKKEKHVKQSNILNISNNNSDLDEYDIYTIFPKKNGYVQIDSKSENCESYFKTRNNDNEEQTQSFLASLSGCVPLDKCDPLAKIYRNTYKVCKMELARKLFDLYNKKVFNNNIPSDTLLEWSDRMRGTAGFCYCRKIIKTTSVVQRCVRIVLAAKILDSADRLRDTLIHEMCHAATWIVDEISDGHGPFWKAWANKAMKVFPELPPIKRCHDYQINTKYIYKCSDCGYSIGRHSKSLDIDRKRCGYCYGKFEVFINKITKKGLQSITPVTPKKEATGFALYVKENYTIARKENMTHADVMKILSKQFNNLKTK